mgnify:CR=1 FL=1
MFESSDADIIVGSRNLDKSGYDGYTFLRRVASKSYIRFINLVAGFSKYRLSDSQCGFKGFRAAAAKKTVVRLHTGDPSLYGAVREQMDALVSTMVDILGETLYK